MSYNILCLENIEKLPVHCHKEIMIAGCGNKLFGADEFGPELVEYLMKNYNIPENICLMDVGRE